MKHKKLLCVVIASVLALSVAGLAACGDEPAPEPELPTAKGSLLPTEGYKLPTYEEADKRTSSGVSVHDPSVFYDPVGKKYYAFGTHFAVASSFDLITWKQESSDNQWDKLYDTANPVTYAGKQWPAALDATLALVKPTMNGNDTISTTWAPDVNYYNGKYYMYYSITKAFGSPESAIGRVESENVMGPYSNNTILIDSVGTNGATTPNCIDPELFTDKDGGLWMVYGSFFGGVYIKELYNSGSNWGLPKEEEGWGKLLWKGGYSAGVEGPFIFYNPLTEYYYLMTSEGDLNTVYNMRIARSEKPDGPYLDVTGKDVASEGKGNKVAGNFKFKHQDGNGYAAMGHNSVVQDEEGRWFVVYHARRAESNGDVTPGHNLVVSQLFYNEDKWPVMSPVAYVGESFGKITQAQAAGDYEVLLHSVDNAQAAVASVDCTLNADGTVSGAKTGTWSVTQDFYVTVTLDDVVYKGVVVPGWDMYSKASKQTAVFGISAISADGNSLWAVSYERDATT